DTVTLHGKRSDRRIRGGQRLVEVVVNGRPVASQAVPADGSENDLEFRILVERSSWVALRQFPQLHTNPVNVLVGGKPIRASRESAKWCVGVIEQLWKMRGPGIKADERPEAEKTFQKALEMYKKIVEECEEGS